ncbi:MAG: hypothetical protein WCH04_10525 [Gammaproteobacteria bacterium]
MSEMTPASFKTDSSQPSQQVLTIGDYALISDCHSAALALRQAGDLAAGREGSTDQH